MGIGPFGIIDKLYIVILCKKFHPVRSGMERGKCFPGLFPEKGFFGNAGPEQSQRGHDIFRIMGSLQGTCFHVIHCFVPETDGTPLQGEIRFRTGGGKGGHFRPGKKLLQIRQKITVHDPVDRRVLIPEEFEFECGILIHGVMPVQMIACQIQDGAGVIPEIFQRFQLKRTCFQTRRLTKKG